MTRLRGIAGNGPGSCLIRWLGYAVCAVFTAVLGGCYATGNASKPIPTARYTAPQPAQRLVVFLPGRGDDLAALEKSGIAQIIQQAWPDADVELAALTMAYYTDGHASKRLHDEVIAPALRRGYRQVWLAGASLGGMGAISYSRDYPGELHGLLLLAPYLGDAAMRKEIDRAGGLARWQPGPLQPINAGNWQRALWAYLKGWSTEPAMARHTWMAYGDRDRFRRPMQLLAPVLPPGHVFVLKGGHNWHVWKAAMPELLQAAKAGRASRPMLPADALPDPAGG